MSKLNNSPILEIHALVYSGQGLVHAFMLSGLLRFPILDYIEIHVHWFEYIQMDIQRVLAFSHLIKVVICACWSLRFCN